MVIKKVMCACGGGMGSSLLMRLNVEEVLQELNYNDVEVVHNALTDAIEGSADLFVVSEELEYFTKELTNVILIKNIFSKEEIKSKIEDFLNS